MNNVGTPQLSCRVLSAAASTSPRQTFQPRRRSSTTVGAETAFHDDLDESVGDETYDEADSTDDAIEREICQLRADRDCTKRELSELRAECVREIRQLHSAHERDHAQICESVRVEVA